MGGLGVSIRTATPVTPSDGVGNMPLSIGSVFFNSSECPEDLPIGAVKQMAVTHTLPGGTRLVSTFGPDPENVRWKGHLYAQNVDTRIQQLRLYAVAGTRIALSWHTEQYLVVITDFVPHYHHRWYAEYDIEVTVVNDQNGAFTLPNALSIDQQVQGLQRMMLDQNNIIFQIDPDGAQAFQQQIVGVQQAIGDAGPLAKASPTAIAKITSAVNAAQSALNTYAQPLHQLTGVNVPTQLGATIQLASSLTNIATNVQAGQKPAATVIQGIDLFTVAAQQYGNPAMAFQLASANGLISPWLTRAQQTKITLPPLGTSSLP